MRYSPIAVVCGVAFSIAYGPASAQQLEEAKRALADAKTCIVNAYSTPAATPLRPHIPLDLNAVTLAQLSDSRYPTKAEAAALTAIHPLLGACRSQLIRRLNSSAPGDVSTLERLFAAGDDDRVLLIQRRLTWGDFVRRGRDRMLAASAESRQQADGLAARQQQIQADQVQQRRAEALLEAQRRALEQQQFQQNLDRMNTYWVPFGNRLQANCSYGGGYINCN
jgi:hypothetical protein